MTGTRRVRPVRTVKSSLSHLWSTRSTDLEGTSGDWSFSPRFSEKRSSARVSASHQRCKCVIPYTVRYSKVAVEGNSEYVYKILHANYISWTALVGRITDESNTIISQVFTNKLLESIWILFVYYNLSRSF